MTEGFGKDGIGGSPSPVSPVGSKALVRLLKQVVRGPCHLPEGAEADELVLTGASGQGRHASEVVQAALSAGLLERQGERLSARPEAIAFLRRQLAEVGDEPFAGQHRLEVEETVEVARVRQAVRRNLLESPLAALVRLKDRDGKPFFGEEAIAAGERLAADFERGQLTPRVTASWEPRLAQRMAGERGGLQDLSDTALAARLRVNRAVEAMGPDLSGVALDVCCFCKGLELVERERGWPVRSAKLMLRTALLALARHYAPPPGRPRRHAWGAEDFRPQL
ncbi:DUF6456 domain-containing protein [Rhizobium straminoryzae]|uniref:DUF6456 domain-containing protein n=1 Tax=Rhizobium straminoryzae TaxID=1387186 RepID=UPI001FE39AA8|nr:DUF6456 domain-containing protein [Rhizobium straminoryzae]